MIELTLLTGGSSNEHEVSMLSAGLIIENLDKIKYNVRELHIPKVKSKDWIYELLNNPPDIVLSALHGGLGENGAVQGLLECIGVPYVGSKVMSSAICMDKAMSKLIMKANNIPVIDDVFIKRNENITPFMEKIAELGYPLMVKPNNGGSSIGMSVVRSKEELDAAITLVKSWGDDILIEKYISGREVTCGVVETEKGIEVLTVLDIDTDNVFYDYEAKYTAHITKIELSTLPGFMQTMIQEIAKKVFSVLNCVGYGRVDMLVKEEQVYVVEMNTLPGLTPHSLIPKAAVGVGMSFGQFLDKLIQYELSRQI